MITTILGLLGIAGWGSGALGLAGLALKLLGKFVPSVAESVLSNPITAAVGKVAEGFVDLILWVAKALLTWVGVRLGNAVDHITQNVWASALVMALCWGAYGLGGVGRYDDSPAKTSPPAAKSEPAKANSKAAAKQPQTTDPFNPFDWLSNHFR